MDSIHHLSFDGWYTDRADAEGVARLVEEEGAVVLGILRSGRGPSPGYGVLYMLPPERTPESWYFPDHALPDTVILPWRPKRAPTEADERTWGFVDLRPVMAKLEKRSETRP